MHAGSNPVSGSILRGFMVLKWSLDDALLLVKQHLKSKDYDKAEGTLKDIIKGMKEWDRLNEEIK